MLLVSSSTGGDLEGEVGNDDKELDVFSRVFNSFVSKKDKKIDENG